MRRDRRGCGRAASARVESDQAAGFVAGLARAAAVAWAVRLAARTMMEKVARWSDLALDERMYGGRGRGLEKSVRRSISAARLYGWIDSHSCGPSHTL